MIKWRHQYDEKADQAAREHCDVHCCEESLTQQQFKQDCDLNVIVERFGIKDHEMPVPPADPRAYGDVSDMPDLRRVLEIGREAEAAFMRLPAAVRTRFHNNPAVLHEFVTNPENREEAENLGLLARQEAPRRRAEDPRPKRRSSDREAAEAAQRELEEYRSGRRKPPVSPEK